MPFRGEAEGFLFVFLLASEGNLQSHESFYGIRDHRLRWEGCWKTTRKIRSGVNCMVASLLAKPLSIVPFDTWQRLSADSQVCKWQISNLALNKQWAGDHFWFCSISCQFLNVKQIFRAHCREPYSKGDWKDDF